MKSAITILFAIVLGGCVSPALVATPHSEPPAADNAHTEILPPAKEARPNFSGHWQLNARASDDWMEKLKSAMGSMKGRSGGEMGRGGRGGRGGGMKGQGRGGAEQMAHRRGADLDEIRFPRTSKTLDIVHADPMLTVTDEDERVQRIYTDFRGASISASGSLQQQVTTAGWEHGTLVVETTANNGQRLIQSYRLEAESGRLVVLAEILIPQLPEPIRIRQLYEPAPTHATAH